MTVSASAISRLVVRPFLRDVLATGWNTVEAERP